MSDVVADPDFPRKTILRLRKRAERKARKPEELTSLASRAYAKYLAVRPHLRSLRKDLPTMIRLIRAYAAGTYRRIPWRGIVAIVAAVLYFLMPLDAIPDFIPVIGYLDDAAVIAYVMHLLRGEMQKFVSWEAAPSE